MIHATPDPRYDANKNGFLSAKELRTLLLDLDFVVDDVRTNTHTHTRAVRARRPTRMHARTRAPFQTANPS